MAKEKAPAMPFYGKDFYDDENVLVMSLEQQGAYIRLLWKCWSEGSIPADQEKLAAILRVSAEQFAPIWARIAACFKPASKAGDRLVNRKVEEIRAERQAYLDKCSLGGKRGSKARWGSDKSTHADPTSDSSQPDESTMTLQSASAIAYNPLPPSREPHEPETDANSPLWRAFEECRAMHPNCTDPDLAAQCFLSLIDNGRVTETDADQMVAGMRRWLDSQVWEPDQCRFSREWRKFSEWINGLAWRAKPAPGAAAKESQRATVKSSRGVDPYAQWEAPWAKKDKNAA